MLVVGDIPIPENALTSSGFVMIPLISPLGFFACPFATATLVAAAFATTTATSGEPSGSRWAILGLFLVAALSDAVRGGAAGLGALTGLVLDGRTGLDVSPCEKKQVGRRHDGSAHRSDAKSPKFENIKTR